MTIHEIARGVTEKPLPSRSLHLKEVKSSPKKPFTHSKQTRKVLSLILIAIVALITIAVVITM